MYIVFLLLRDIKCLPIVDIGYFLVDIGYFLVDIGYFLVDIGYFLVNIGYFLVDTYSGFRVLPVSVALRSAKDDVYICTPL